MRVDSPNPVLVGWSMVRSLIRVEPPRPAGTGSCDHSLLGNALSRLATEGTHRLPDVEPMLVGYLEDMRTVDPDGLTPDEAKAFWINLYNAGALRLAASAQSAGEDSVLRVPGAFRSSFIVIDGQALSLDDVEHAKVRRFGDPRVHGALVCGSVSCPTLRKMPYVGEDLDAQLDDQLRSFLANGGAVPDSANNTISLSRVFNWFGSDFVRPHRMPTFLPSSSQKVLPAIGPWLSAEAAELAARGARVEYQTYDWGLRCSVA